MELENLYLELTRDCTLQCEHCLKGDREKKDMSLETISLIFKDIKKIDTLLLTGGEPLLNREALKYITKTIKENSIDVKTIGLITNGTICNDWLIDILSALRNSCEDFQFILSSDLFHRLEWKRLGIEDKINGNYEIYKESLAMRKFLDNDRFHKVILRNKGRAVNLTKTRLEELKSKQYVEYRLEDAEEETIKLENNRVSGKLFFDVNGNLGYYSNSFLEEDNNSNYLYNIHNYDLFSIINNYINTGCDDKPKIYTLY